MSMESRSTKSRRRKTPDVFPHLLTRAHRIVSSLPKELEDEMPEPDVIAKLLENAG